MICSSEKCDRKSICALWIGNKQQDSIESDNIEDLSDLGWGAIGSNIYEQNCYCGPSGDYKLFEEYKEECNEDVLLEMLPVCKCKNVIEKIEVVNDVTRDGNVVTSTFHLSPRRCPKCGRHIKGITIKDNFFGLFNGDKYEDADK